MAQDRNRHPNDSESDWSDCTLCPRKCHADRQSGEVGCCGQTAELVVARAALHFWEEPCICSEAGSGAVFFSGCGLRCVFCQNRSVSLNGQGKTISPKRLAEIFLELQAQGADNINLVTPTHFVPRIASALRDAREQGLTLPIVYNTGSYEEVDTLRKMEGLVDIYLPDLKYYDPELSGRLSGAPDYFEKAAAAIAEMYRQTGAPLTDPDTGLLRRGVLARHLLLPGQTRDSKKILRYLRETYGDNIYISILNQYTPMPGMEGEMNRTVTDAEYRRVLRFAEKIGITLGFCQESSAADAQFIPEFDCRGV